MSWPGPSDGHAALALALRGRRSPTAPRTTMKAERGGPARDEDRRGRAAPRGTTPRASDLVDLVGGEASKNGRCGRKARDVEASACASAHAGQRIEPRRCSARRAVFGRGARRAACALSAASLSARIEGDRVLHASAAAPRCDDQRAEIVVRDEPAVDAARSRGRWPCRCRSSISAISPNTLPGSELRDGELLAAGQRDARPRPRPRAARRRRARARRGARAWRPARTRPAWPPRAGARARRIEAIEERGGSRGHASSLAEGIEASGGGRRRHQRRPDDQRRRGFDSRDVNRPHDAAEHAWRDREAFTANDASFRVCEHPA